MKKLALLIAIIATLMFAFTGCEPSFATVNANVKNPQALITIDYTDSNNISKSVTIKYELRYDKAPITVSNFVKLVKAKYYDNILVETVAGKGSNFSQLAYLLTGKYALQNDLYKLLPEKKYNIIGEFTANKWVDKDGEAINDLTIDIGSLVMFRSSGAENMNTADTQFYISLSDNNSRQGNYAVFGTVLGSSSVNGSHVGEFDEGIPAWFVADMFGTTTENREVEGQDDRVLFPKYDIVINISLVDAADINVPSSYPTIRKTSK